MSKIVLVGAGGVIFAQNFLKDILTDPELRTHEVTLMDIDAGRLANAVAVAGLIAAKLGIRFTPHATTDLREALNGANYVITIFRSGTIRHQELEYEIPMKYGIDQVVSDTLGPGGIFRGLRTLKDLFEVLDVMEQECPGAYLLNYVNPMSMNTIALSRRAPDRQGRRALPQRAAHFAADCGVDRNAVRKTPLPCRRRQPYGVPSET